MFKKIAAKQLVSAALIAALYAVLTYVSAALGLAYGNIQFRLSEALNVLALFTPAAIPGLTIGCIISNIASPFGILDVIVGSIATLLASTTIYFLGKLKIKKSCLLSPLPPAIFNALLVGLEITLFMPSGTATFTAFLISAVEVGIGELAVCFILGLPLYYVLKNKWKF